jgi:hypothetical protein
MSSKYHQQKIAYHKQKLAYHQSKLNGPPVRNPLDADEILLGLLVTMISNALMATMLAETSHPRREPKYWINRVAKEAIELHKRSPKSVIDDFLARHYDT